LSCTCQADIKKQKKSVEDEKNIAPLGYKYRTGLTACACPLRDCLVCRTTCAGEAC